MSALATLLTKEYREQRLPLAIVFGLGILGALTAGLLVDTWLLDSEILARVLTFAFGGLAALTLGCDIGARERGEGSLSFTLRQPFGLGQAVASKAIVLVGATLGGIGLGYAVSRLVTHLFGSGLGDLQGTPGELVAVGCIVSAGLWCAAASSFLPRGFLAAPGGLVVWLVCAAPAWVPIVWWELRPDAAVAATLACALLLGGLAAFVAGQTVWVRRSDSQVLRAGVVIGAGMLGCLPLWAAAAIQTWSALHFDPAAGHAKVATAFVADDGRHVHLTVDTGERDWRGRPIGHFPLVLDAESGALRQVGPAGHTLSPASNAGFVEGRIPGSLLIDFERAVVDALDAAGGSTEVAALVEAGADAGLTPPEGWRVAHRAGLGWALASDREGIARHVGPDGEDELDREGLLARVEDARVLRAWATSEAWLVWVKAPGARERWYLRSTADGWEPVAWIGADEQLVTVLPDGTPLVASAIDAGPLWAVDPSTGERAELVSDDGQVPSARWQSVEPHVGTGDWQVIHSAGLAPGDSLRVLVELGPDGRRVRARSDSLPSGLRTVGRLEDGSVLLRTERELWSLAFDGAEPERLFPPTD